MDKGLIFLPLGGCGEIGLNVNLYGVDDNWIMVDLGISFPDETFPGADVVLPEIGFAEALGDKLKAIIVTHAHEDHLGAIHICGADSMCYPLRTLHRICDPQQAEGSEAGRKSQNFDTCRRQTV